jgi:hypothetical protein
MAVGWVGFRMPIAASARDFLSALFTDHRRVLNGLKLLLPAAAGMDFAANSIVSRKIGRGPENGYNPLREYFEANKTGPGIWKWVHYFDIYHRHFQKFIGSDVHVMEIGIYSGGSLPMWREYFGNRSHIYGVDIETACRVYESERIKILIGDQSDRKFWAEAKSMVPQIDIVIDDGGHHPEHQIITLEEMLPHVSPGGVYVCEDIHGSPNRFASFVYGIASRLNSGRLSDFEKTIGSIHLYPFMAVIEKAIKELQLSSEKRGTRWQPFLDHM